MKRFRICAMLVVVFLNSPAAFGSCPEWVAEAIRFHRRLVRAAKHDVAKFRTQMLVSDARLESLKRPEFLSATVSETPAIRASRTRTAQMLDTLLYDLTEHEVTLWPEIRETLFHAAMQLPYVASESRHASPPGFQRFNASLLKLVNGEKTSEEAFWVTYKKNIFTHEQLWKLAHAAHPSVRLLAMEHLARERYDKNIPQNSEFTAKAVRALVLHYLAEFTGENPPVQMDREWRLGLISLFASIRTEDPTELREAGETAKNLIVHLLRTWSPRRDYSDLDSEALKKALSLFHHLVVADSDLYHTMHLLPLLGANSRPETRDHALDALGRCFWFTLSAHWNPREPLLQEIYVRNFLREVVEVQLEWLMGNPDARMVLTSMQAKMTMLSGFRTLMLSRSQKADALTARLERWAPPWFAGVVGRSIREAVVDPLRALENRTARHEEVLRQSEASAARLVAARK